jgi:hypothetical protein
MGGIKSWQLLEEAMKKKKESSMAMGRERLSSQERANERKSLAGLVERYQVACPFHCHKCHSFFILYYPPSNLTQFQHQKTNKYAYHLYIILAAKPQND